MIFPSWLLALFLVQSPFQPAPDKIICWDNVVVNRDFISWTAWDCQRGNREEALGPKITYKTFHNSGVVTIVGPNRTPRTFPIPAYDGKQLFEDLSRVLEVLGAVHRNSHRSPSPATTNAPVKI